MSVQSRERNLRPEVRDVFLCHTSEDKEAIVNPLFESLVSHGISCWYDQAEIRWGDSIPQKVNEGLQISRYVLVVLSTRFLGKSWPQRELHAALNLEASSGRVKVLPLICGSLEERKQILEKLPLLSDKLFLVWDGNPQDVVSQLLTLDWKGRKRPPPRSARSQFETRNHVSGVLSTAKPDEVLKQTAVIFRLGESYLRQAYWFLVFGLAGIFASLFAASLSESKEGVYLWAAGMFFCVVTGILLHVVGDLYKEAHIRYPFTSTPVIKHPYLVPFGSTWRKMWAANQRYPELRQAMVAWVAALGSGLAMSVFLVLAVWALL